MANGTPESEFSIECFQNYTAPEVFIQGLAGMVNQSDVETMIRAQKQMLQRFEKTNEMLTNCNALSASRLKLAGAEFKKHTQLLVDMKKDLDYIFKKIRVLKTKLSNQYPVAFEIAQKANQAKICPDDDEFDVESNSQPQNQSALSKDISKSTETLRPSISQVFSKSPNEIETPTNSKDAPTLQNANNQDNSNNVASTNTVENAAKVTTNVDSKLGKDANVARVEKILTDKEKRNSSASSSSDNSNTCESSGDCTSDTG